MTYKNLEITMVGDYYRVESRWFVILQRNLDYLKQRIDYYDNRYTLNL